MLQAVYPVGVCAPKSMLHICMSLHPHIIMLQIHDICVCDQNTSSIMLHICLCVYIILICTYHFMSLSLNMLNAGRSNMSNAIHS